MEFGRRHAVFRVVSPSDGRAQAFRFALDSGVLSTFFSDVVKFFAGIQIAQKISQNVLEIRVTFPFGYVNATIVRVFVRVNEGRRFLLCYLRRGFSLFVEFLESFLHVGKQNFVHFPLEKLDRFVRGVLVPKVFAPKVRVVTDFDFTEKSLLSLQQFVVLHLVLLRVLLIRRLRKDCRKAIFCPPAL